MDPVGKISYEVRKKISDRKIEELMEGVDKKGMLTVDLEDEGCVITLRLNYETEDGKVKYACGKIMDDNPPDHRPEYFGIYRKSYYGMVIYSPERGWRNIDVEKNPYFMPVIQDHLALELARSAGKLSALPPGHYRCSIPVCRKISEELGSDKEIRVYGDDEGNMFTVLKGEMVRFNQDLAMQMKAIADHMKEFEDEFELE